MKITYQEAVAIVNREALVNSLVSKYMSILKIKGKRPKIEIQNRLEPGWLGRCEWNSNTSDISTIRLLSSVMTDPTTLERVIAHEMVHHRNFIEPGRDHGHGADFVEGASIVNAVMGPDFVTEFSDKSYVQAKNDTYFYLVVVPAANYGFHRSGLPYSQKADPDSASVIFGYAWMKTLSPTSKALVAKVLTVGGKLFKTTDERWLHGRKLDRTFLFTIPKAESEDQSVLAELHSGKTPMGTFQIRKP